MKGRNELAPNDIPYTKGWHSAAVLPTVAYTSGTVHSGKYFLKKLLLVHTGERDKKDCQK